MNRTLSCTVGEHFLIKAWWWLKQNGQNCDSISGIARMAVQTVANQLEGMPPQDVIDQFRQTFEGVGRTTKTGGMLKFSTGVIGASSAGSYDIIPKNKPYWEQAGCPSKETFEMWTQYLIKNNMTNEDCSYSDFVKLGAKDGIKNRLSEFSNTQPIAVNDTPEELNERVRERQQREQQERDEFTRATIELAKQLHGGDEHAPNEGS